MPALLVVPTLLVVEDEPDMASLVVAMLKVAGPWRVETTNRLDSAVDRLSAGAFDVALLDLNLPDSTGLQTVARLVARAPGLPIVVVTSMHDAGAGQAAVRLGAQDFLPKGSFDAHLLARTLLLAIERKRATEALRRAGDAEARYRTLFEANPQPLWVFDLETLRILTVNEAACRHYGYSPEEFVALTIADIRPVEDGPALLQQLSGPAAGLRSAGIWRHRKKDGSIIDVEVHSHGLTFDGRPSRLVLVHDVTERRKLEERATQQQKMEAVGRLASGVAHDFNNLVGVISGYAELILRSAAPESALARRSEEILKAAASAGRLTQQLMTFSKPRDTLTEVVDLNLAVVQMESLLRRLIGEHIQLETRLEPGEVSARIDPSQLEQIVMNLALNARDAMMRGGRLVIETAFADFDPGARPTDPQLKSGRFAVISISDTGAGMTSEVVAHIFEPFFTTKGPGRGTGLGLATVYGAVQQAGGQIYVYSEPGHGSTFKIYLPLTPGEIGSAAVSVGVPRPHLGSAEARAAVSGAEREGMDTILLVEDEPALQAILAEMLHEGGHQVYVAVNPEDAVRVARERRIDLLLTDVVMPGMMGPALAEKVLAECPATKVLYMSGYTGDSAVGHALPGISGRPLIEKPFTSDALLRAVRDCLSARV